jgi:hypothetical protein
MRPTAPFSGVGTFQEDLTHNQNMGFHYEIAFFSRRWLETRLVVKETTNEKVEQFNLSFLSPSSSI